MLQSISEVIKTLLRCDDFIVVVRDRFLPVLVVFIFRPMLLRNEPVAGKTKATFGDIAGFEKLFVAIDRQSPVQVGTKRLKPEATAEIVGIA